MTWLGGLKVSVQLGFSARPGEVLIYPLQNYFFKNKSGTRFALPYMLNQYRIIMERIEKDYGYMLKDKTGVTYYHGGSTDNGVVYKDSEAFKTGVGICYISEYGLEELEEKLDELNQRKQWLTAEDYLAERKKILEECGETRQSIIDQVREAFGDDYLMTDKQVEAFADDVFGLADWACIATYLAENFEIDDCIEYDHIKGTGMFSDFQYEAVMAGLTPKEYREQLAK